MASGKKSSFLQTPISHTTLILISLVIFCTASIGIYFVLFVKAQQLPMYESSSVEKICQVFRINPDDEFCINHSEQNAHTFEAMLQRYFPVENSLYDDIMSLVEVRFTSPSYEVLEELDTSAVGFCPEQRERDEIFSCTILFSPPVGPLNIYFDSSTQTVVKYIASRPSSS